MRRVVNVPQYLEDLTAVLERLPMRDVLRVQEVLLDAWRAERTIFVAGNGGSAATASHMVNDLNKGAIVDGQPRFRALALTDNIPLITAWSNDTAYHRAFVEQMMNFLRPGDVLIAISGSGNSPNIIAAVEWAREAGALTVGFTGGTGGRLRALVEHCVVVPSNRMEQIEDAHLALSHALCVSLRAAIAAGSSKPALVD